MISIEHLEEADWLTIEEARALEGISRREMYNRLKPGDPNFVDSQKLAPRGTAIRASMLSAKAQEKLREKGLERVQEAARAIPPEAAGQMSMFPKTEIDMQILNIPPGPGRDLTVKRYRAIQPVLNHDFKALHCRSHSGLIRAVAATQEVSPTTVRRWVENFIEGGYKIESLADRPLGRPPGARTVLDASCQAHVIDCWQLQKLTKMQTYRSLNNYQRTKQRGVGTSWSYVLDGTGQDFVSRPTVERFIDDRLGGEDNPWRRGGTAIKDAAGYMDRAYDECAGDTWCIDEWELDGIFFEPSNHSVLVQNPHAYLLTIIDERTTCIIGRKLVRSLSPDEVLDLLEETVRTYGKPKFFVRDKGGHFWSKVGGRVTIRKQGELMEMATGALGKLGVEIRSPGREKIRASTESSACTASTPIARGVTLDRPGAARDASIETASTCANFLASTSVSRNTCATTASLETAARYCSRWMMPSVSLRGGYRKSTMLPPKPRALKA